MVRVQAAAAAERAAKEALELLADAVVEARLAYFLGEQVVTPI